MENLNYTNENNNGLISAEDMQQILGQAIGVTKINAESIAVMLEDLRHMKNIVGGLTTRMNGIDDTITTQGDRLNNLEYSTELTTSQVSIFVEKIKSKSL